MLAKGQITVSNLDDGKTPFLHQAYKMKDGRFLKHYPVYEASPVNGYKEGDLWHRTDGSQPGYFVANKSNTTLNLNDWTFYANELAYSDADKFYPKFEGAYSDYNEVASDDQTKYTWKIIKADDGIGIKSVKEYYAVSTSNITPPSLPSDWSETPKATDTTNKYLWNYEVYTYSNGDTKETTKRVIGTHGATGATGNGITSVTNYYLATTLGTGVTIDRTATQEWTTAVQKTDPVKKYLWNYEEILYTNGSNIPTAPVIIGTHGEKGDKGDVGADAKLLYLSASAEAMTFNSDNSPNPATQTITFTANMQNATGTATFIATPYNGTNALTNITLGGSGNTRTLTQAQFPATATRIQITATLGNLTDTVSVMKLKNGKDGGTGAKGETGSAGANGKNAVVGYLTNESVTFPATSAGVVSSGNLALANGTFKVFDGLTEKTGTGITYTVENQTGAIGAITTAGAYSVSKISADNASITFRAAYSGVNIDKVLTLSKSKEGVKGDKGDNAPLVKLSGATQIITESSTGTGTPTRTPSASFTVVGTSVNTTISAWTYSINGGTFGTGLPTGVSRDGNTVKVIPGSITFNTLSIKATGGGVSDTFTIARIVDGEKGAKGETGSTGSAGKDAYTVLLSNESHTFQAGTTNAVAGSTTTDIHAYKGTNKVAVTVGTITGMPTGMTGTIISNGTVNAGITFTVATNMTSPSGVVTIPLTVDGKIFNKEFSYALTFKGHNAVVGLLTNESITLPANKDGLVSNFTGANGVFDVYDGITKKTGTGTAYSVVGQPTNITVDIHATTGVYKVTAMPTGTTILNGHATLKAIYNGVTIEKQLNVAKSVTGATGATGATGPQGATGASGKDGVAGKDGKGITSTTITYGLSTTDTVEPTKYTSNVPTLVKGQYLWTKTVWKYTDNTTETGYTKTYIAKDGNTGKDGLAGKDGVGISSTKIEYAGSTSGTTKPTSGWNTAVPTVAPGNYLWTKTTWTYTDNTTETGYSVARMGVNGATGGKGDTGAPGASATSYWITASNNIISKSQTGVINPTTITFKGFSKTGTANPVAYSGRFIIQTSTNGTTYDKKYTSSTNQDTCTYTIPANTLFVKCLFYMAGGTTVLLDEQTVPIVESAEGIEVGGRNLAVYSTIGEYAGGNNMDTLGSKVDIEGTKINVKRHLNDLIAFSINDVSQYSKLNVSFYSDLTSPTMYYKFDNTAQSNMKFTKENNIFTGILNVPVGAVSLVIGLGEYPRPATFKPYYIDRVMVEKGNIATDWTPAPEDARNYKAWANSSDGSVDFTRVYPNENLFLEPYSSYESATYAYRDINPELGDMVGKVYDKDTSVSITGVYFGFTEVGVNGDASDNWLMNNGVLLGNASTTGVKSKRRYFSFYPKDEETLDKIKSRFNIKIEVGSEPTIYTTNPQDSLSGSIPKYVGFSPIDSDVSHEYEWIMNPEYAQALADEALAGKVDNDAEYENLKNMAQEVKESYENFVSEGGEYKTEHSKLLDRTTAIETDLGEYRQQINFVDTYMSAGNEGLIIGVKDSEGNPDANAMQMLLSNKSLSFMDGGEVVAYFSGQSFHINRGAIVESLQVGQHKITNLGNGHTVFQYTG